MKAFEHLDASVRFSDDERMLLDSVRALARDVIAPRAAEYDRTGDFPWTNVQAINALGLNAMFVPEAYGGAPLSYAAYLECVREISKACASTGIVWATNFHAMKPLIDFGTEEQKQRLLPGLAKGAPIPPYSSGASTHSSPASPMSVHRRRGTMPSFSHCS